MTSIKSVSLCIFLITNTLGQLLVTLPNGQIQGHELQTFTNKSYYAYQSIPFATPPLDDLRFQAPQPAQNWTGILNATEDSHMCYQLQYDGPEESEDCLYINVFTPILNRGELLISCSIALLSRFVQKLLTRLSGRVEGGWRTGKPPLLFCRRIHRSVQGIFTCSTAYTREVNYTKLPVIFWIYGGGLRNGAARFQEYRPDYWMDEDIILVTHNYRVGIFGFLSTGDSVIPGNNGLKDQNLALRWTYENIHLFGGDNNKITVHGQSAGAVSSSYHLLIKQSEGLFRSVIAESGTPLNMYSFLENPKEYALQLTQAINPNISSDASSEEIRDFLLSLEGKTIDTYSRAPKITQPAVVLEPESSTAVVTKEMYELFDAGDFYQVPILMGICSEESLFIAKSNNTLIKLGRTYDADPSLVVPNIFPHPKIINKTIIGEAIKLVYLNNSDQWADHPGRVVRHYSDQRFSRGIIKQGKLISQYAPVYFYQFSYDGDVGGVNVVVEDAEKIQHAEELSYVFLNRNLSEISEPDALTHNRLIRLWSNFVKYQNPTPSADDDLLQNITWPAVSPTNYKYLDINDTLSIRTNPKQEFFSKWEDIFKTYGRRPFSTF